MSHITLAQQGLAAVEAKTWDEAVTKLSKALQSSPNPTWLLGRSKALINLRRYDEALDDANLAWHKAYERNKRPQMVDAHYRRAVAYFRKGQLANADCCCVFAMRLIKGHPALEKGSAGVDQWIGEGGVWTATLQDAMHEARNDEMNKSKDGDGGVGMAMSQNAPAHAKEWRMASTLRIQILSAMDKLAEGDEARRLTVSLKPEVKDLADLGDAEGKAKEEKAKEVANAAVPVQASKPVVPKDTPMRLQEFQSNTSMSVSIFSKGVNKEKLKVEFLDKAVRLDPLVYPSGDEGEFRLDLWGEIDASASKYTVTPNKVELNLTKKTAGKWPQLKSDGNSSAAPAPTPATSTTSQPPQSKPASEPTAQANTSTQPEEPKAAPAPAPAPASGPAYPTSSRTGPKNWDNIDVEGGSDDEGQDVNFFFKKLYKDATPEQQRAMMKSFTESNGTSLSTDWNDVKGRTVETVPPEGVEAKKWK